MALAVGVGLMQTGVTHNAYSDYGPFLALSVGDNVLCGFLIIGLPSIRTGRSGPLIEVTDLHPGCPAA